jgi:hypothetical protein
MVGALTVEILGLLRDRIVHAFSGAPEMTASAIAQPGGRSTLDG